MHCQFSHWLFAPPICSSETLIKELTRRWTLSHGPRTQHVQHWVHPKSPLSTHLSNMRSASHSLVAATVNPVSHLSDIYSKAFSSGSSEDLIESLSLWLIRDGSPARDVMRKTKWAKANCDSLLLRCFLNTENAAVFIKKGTWMGQFFPLSGLLSQHASKLKQRILSTIMI